MFNVLVKYSNELIVLYTKKDLSIVNDKKVTGMDPPDYRTYAWSIDNELINVKGQCWTNQKEITILDENCESMSFPMYHSLVLNNFSSDENYVTIRTPRARNFGTSDSLFYTSIDYPTAETFLDSLPDWTGDSNTHEVSIRFKPELQGNEKLMNLIQRTNEKGWTVYENYY